MDNKRNDKLSSTVELRKIMLRELSWKGLKEILASNREFLLAYQRGGYDFDKKNRPRAERILVNKIIDKDEVEVFLLWYKEQGRYREFLDPYVLDNDLVGSQGECTPEQAKLVIKEVDYSSLIRILTNEHAKLFLFYCERLFSEKQRDGLLAISEANSAAKDERIKSLEITNTYLETIKDLKLQLQEAKSNVKKFTRNDKNNQAVIKQYEQEIAELAKKNAIQEGLLQKHRSGIEDQIDFAKREISEELIKCKEALFAKCVSAGDIKAKFGKAVQQIEIKTRENAELIRRYNEVNDLDNLRFQKILHRVDLQKIILSLNEPDEVKEKLNTVVKPQTRDDSAPKEGREDDIKGHWENMIKREFDLMEKICRMYIGEISDAYYINWGNHTDDFNDLIYSLRARAVLIKMIHEILWQNKQ